MSNPELLQLYRVFHLLGDAHSLKILYELDLNGERTFSQLRDNLLINPTSLSSRLRVLTQIGFVSSDRSHDNLRVFYSLHEHQRGIKRVLDSIERLSTELS